MTFLGNRRLPCRGVRGPGRFPALAAAELLGDDHDLIHKAVGGMLRDAIEHLEPDQRARYRNLR